MGLILPVSFLKVSAGSGIRALPKQIANVRHYRKKQVKTDDLVPFPLNSLPA
jgi:hypothetical protein